MVFCWKSICRLNSPDLLSQNSDDFLQVPDFLNARINGLPVKEVIKDHKWLEEEFTEKIQKVNFINASKEVDSLFN